MNHKNYFLIALLLFPLMLSAQGIEGLYQRADNYTELFTSKYYYGAQNVRAGYRTSLFYYETQTPDGREYFIIDPVTATQEKAFDKERISAELSKFLNREVDPNNLPIRRVRPEKDSLFFTINDVDHFMTLADYKIAKSQKQNDYTVYYWGLIDKEDKKATVPSPDGKKEAYISEGNLWVKDIKTGERKQLSNDGSPYEYYSSYIYWSPDSRKIVCSKYSPVEYRKLLLIASSPTTQLQPLTEEYEYPKPGDALPIRRPALFMVETGEIVHFDIPNVEQQYYLDNIRWNKNSDFDMNPES